jgi:hypothetical protein
MGSHADTWASNGFALACTYTSTGAAPATGNTKYTPFRDSAVTGWGGNESGFLTTARLFPGGRKGRAQASPFLVRSEKCGQAS